MVQKLTFKPSYREARRQLYPEVGGMIGCRVQAGRMDAGTGGVRYQIR